MELMNLVSRFMPLRRFLIDRRPVGHVHEFTNANVLYNLHHPSVPLEHIDSVTNIECPEDGVITFSFSKPDLFKLAMETWPKNGDDFVLVDNTDGCGEPGTRTFFYVDEYTMDEKTHSVRAKGEMLDGNEQKIIHSWEANWAHNRPAEPHSTSSLSLHQRWWDPITKRIADIAPQPTKAAKLAERLFGLGNPVDSVTSAFGGVASDASSAVAPVATQAASAGAGAGSAVASVASDATTAAASVVSTASAGAASVASKATSAVGGAASKASTEVQSIESKASTEVQNIATKASNGFHSIAGSATSIAENIVSHLPHADWSKNFTKQIDLSAPTEDDTPWNQKGYKLPGFAGITPYCLNCTLKGTLSMSGHIKVVPADPEDMLQAADFHLYLADLTAALIIGLDVSHFTTPIIPAIKKGIISEALQPFEIPNVFVDGPQINELAEIQLAVSATGNLKTGISFHWDSAEAHIDLLQDEKVNASGWEPKIDHTFEAPSDGQLGLNATLTGPHSFGCGLNILNSLFDKEVKVENYAGLKVDMTANFETGKTKRGYKHNYREHARDLLPRELSRKDEGQCNSGTEVSLAMYEKLRGDVIGFYGHNFFKTTVPIASTCISTAASDKVHIPIGSAVGTPVTVPDSDSALGSGVPLPTGQVAASAFPSFSAHGTGTGPTAGASAGSGAPAPTGKR